MFKYKSFNKTLLLVGLSIASINDLQAQSYIHFTLWSRFLVSKQFNDKLMVSAEYLYRRQNNFLVSKLNIFENPLLNCGRVTFSYRYKKWQYSLSPSYWESNQLLGSEADFQRKVNPEIRLMAGVEYFDTKPKRQFQWRTQYEYRIFTDRTVGRFRTRALERFVLNDDNDFILSAEPLFGVMPNYNPKLFEQLQISAIIQHQFTKHLESELGYRYIFRHRRSTPEIDHENALVAGVFVRL